MSRSKYLHAGLALMALLGMTATGTAVTNASINNTDIYNTAADTSSYGEPSYIAPPSTFTQLFPGDGVQLDVDAKANLMWAVLYRDSEQVGNITLEVPGANTERFVGSYSVPSQAEMPQKAQLWAESGSGSDPLDKENVSLEAWSYSSEWPTITEGKANSSKQLQNWLEKASNAEISGNKIEMTGKTSLATFNSFNYQRVEDWHINASIASEDTIEAKVKFFDKYGDLSTQETATLNDGTNELSFENKVATQREAKLLISGQTSGDELNSSINSIEIEGTLPDSGLVVGGGSGNGIPIISSLLDGLRNLVDSVVGWIPFL